MILIKIFLTIVVVVMSLGAFLAEIIKMPFKKFDTIGLEKVALKVRAATDMIWSIKPPTNNYET